MQHFADLPSSDHSYSHSPNSSQSQQGLPPSPLPRRTSALVGGPPPSVLEDREALKNALQGISKLPVVMLRCALVLLVCNRLHSLNVCPTQPQLCYVERQRVQHRSHHKSSTCNRHNDRLLCRHPSLTGKSTVPRPSIGPSPPSALLDSTSPDIQSGASHQATSCTLGGIFGRVRLCNPLRHPRALLVPDGMQLILLG